MIKNYLLIVFRNIARNKTFTILNIGGFALGMAACILITLFISNEKEFDKIHSKGERIYRLNEWQRYEGTPEQQVALSMYPMGPSLVKDHPEVQSFVRINSKENTITRNKQQQLFQQHLLFVDSTFFDIFDFALVSGNRKEALQSPTSIVITASAAKEMFNTTEAIGKVIEIKRGSEFLSFTISAIAKDVPANSHIQYDMLVPMSGLKKQPWMDTWETNWLNTYLLLNENADPQRLAAALPAFEKKYLGKDDKLYELLLQPFNSIHLYSSNITHDNLNYKKFSASYINTFFILAIAVLLIAVFNFINLSTAVAIKRAKEVGIRKTIGAGQWQLIRQFTTEAVLFSLVSFVLAFIIIVISLPFINDIFQRDIQLGLLQNKELWLSLLAAVIVVGLLSGIYPAIISARYKPVVIVKGVTTLKKGFSLRPVLVVLQFSIAVGFIISTIIIRQQLQYTYKKDMGFDGEQVVLLPMNSTINKKYETFKTQLLSNSLVKDITAYNERLGNNIDQYGASYVSKAGEVNSVSVSHLYVDHNYLDFFKIKLVEGRNFSPEFGDTAGRSYILNETFAKELKVDKTLGTQYKGNWTKEMGSVIGVVKDFNFNSLHHKIAPLFISMQNWDLSEMAVRLSANSTSAALKYIEDVWKKEVPDMPFRYTFLDEHMNSLYEADQQAGIVVNIATFLAIIVACLGLFGMALYNIETRVKEIGIRKVLGASVPGITMTLSGKFLLLVFIAAVISFPVAWFAINMWLEDFAYRVNIQWWVFAAAGFSALVIAFITVSFQSISAALANPVKSLRTE